MCLAHSLFFFCFFFCEARDRTRNLMVSNWINWPRHHYAISSFFIFEAVPRCSGQKIFKVYPTLPEFTKHITAKDPLSRFFWMRPGKVSTCLHVDLDIFGSNLESVNICTTDFFKNVWGGKLCHLLRFQISSSSPSRWLPFPGLAHSTPEHHPRTPSAQRRKSSDGLSVPPGLHREMKPSLLAVE